MRTFELRLKRACAYVNGNYFIPSDKPNVKVTTRSRKHRPVQTMVHGLIRVNM